MSDVDHDRPVVLLSTASSPEEGARIAHALVAERLAACCNLLPGVRSIYRWKEEVEEATEVVIIIKSVASRVEPIAARILELHSYQTPELVVLPVEGGLESYLQWIADNANGR
jgi:periplasmic divalent cation tolerance protein